MSRSRGVLTDEEHQERRRQDRARLEAAIAELLTSDGWKRWLRTRSVLHGYSWRNTLLIASQCRERGIEAKQVAGFRAWLRLGRSVRKGEKGLAIWAPMTLKVKSEDDSGREVEEKRTGFRIVKVFDVSQTDLVPGADPAPLAPPRGGHIDGDSHAHLIPLLECLATETGYRVEWTDTLGGPLGICHRRQRDPLIEVVSTLAPNAKVAVLIHELCHALLGPASGLTYNVEEVVVEAATYVACSAVGLATDVDSVPYVAGWAKTDDPINLLREVATRIDVLAARIEKAVAPPDPQDTTSSVATLPSPDAALPAAAAAA